MRSSKSKIMVCRYHCSIPLLGGAKTVPWGPHQIAAYVLLFSLYRDSNLFAPRYVCKQCNIDEVKWHVWYNATASMVFTYQQWHQFLWKVRVLCHPCMYMFLHRSGSHFSQKILFWGQSSLFLDWWSNRKIRAQNQLKKYSGEMIAVGNWIKDMQIICNAWGCLNIRYCVNIS